MSSELALVFFAERQHGVVTRAELLDADVSPQTIKTWIATGRLRVIYRGVYGVGGAPRTWYQELTAAVLACGPGAMSIARSSIELWHLDGPERGCLDVWVPPTRRVRVPGVTIHRNIDEPRTVIRHGIPTSDPMRALLDLGQSAPWALPAALDEARGRKLISDVAMRRLLDELGRSGRNGIGPLRAYYARFDPTERQPDSPKEPKLARLLEGVVPRPAFQKHVYDRDGRWLGRADWLVAPPLLTIENDGYEPHSSPEAFEADRRRWARFKAAGLEVLIYTPTRVKQEPLMVKAEIQDAINRRLEMVRAGFLVSWGGLTTSSDQKAG